MTEHTHTYQSLFNIIAREPNAFSFKTPYKSLLTCDVLVKNLFCEHSDPVSQVLAAGRLIRAAVQYKIEMNPNHDTDLINRCVGITTQMLGPEVYGNPNYNDMLATLDRSFTDGRVVILEPDTVSWKACDPLWANEALSYLTKIASKKKTSGDVLFIALGNGGFLPGLDLFLRYCNSSNNSVFYPVRYSRGKSRDIWPAVTKTEAEYLCDMRVGRTAIIYDEDVSSGRTVLAAQKFFKRMGLGKAQVVTSYNSCDDC